MGKKITTEQMDKVLSMVYLEDRSQDDAAKTIGVSKASVSAICRVFKLMRAESYDELAMLIPKDSSCSVPIVNFCSEKLGKKLPPVITSAIAKRSEAVKARLSKPVEAPAPAPVSKEEPISAENEKVFFIRVLQEMMRMNESLLQLMDVVIPKYTGDLKDCINANADALDSRMKECEKRLEKIEYQTRKRGM